MLALLLCICLVHALDAQRYYERNVLPADSLSSSITTDYDYYAEGFEEEKDIYKWNVEVYPHPINSSRFCNRLKPSHVCDPDSVLSKEHADHLDTYIRKLYKETPCICSSCTKDEGGIVVGIALLKHMYLPYNVHPAKVIRSFAETLRFMWRLGRCDNDILIVVATTDRLSYTDVGKSTNRYLSIHEAHRIFVANKAQFTAGSFFEGLRDILQGYHLATRTMASPVANEEDTVNVGKVAGIIVGCVFLLGIIAFIGVLIYKRYKSIKNGCEDDSVEEGRKEGKRSFTWSKSDIKVIFGSEKRKSPEKAEYQQCDTVDKNSPDEEEEVLNFQLASPANVPNSNTTPESYVTAESVTLEKDLTTAVEGISKTFPTASKNSVLFTDI